MTTVDAAALAPARSLTDTRSFQRYVAAALMPLGPAAVAVLRFVLPYDTNDSPLVAAQKIAADLPAQSMVLWLGLIAAFTLVPGAYAVSRLLRPQVPRLALVAGALLIAGYLGLIAAGGSDAPFYSGIRAGVDPVVLATVFDESFSHPSGFISITIFVVGHVVGSVLLGIAMIRSRVVGATWGVAMLVSQPLHLLAAVVFSSHTLDLCAWGLTAVAMGAAAVAVLRTPNDAWDVPPRSAERRQGS